MQWKESITTAQKDLEKIPSSQVKQIRYEDFINDPTKIASELFAFCDLPESKEILDYVKTEVYPSNTLKWQSVDKKIISAIDNLIQKELKQFGY